MRAGGRASTSPLGLMTSSLGRIPQALFSFTQMQQNWKN